MQLKTSAHVTDFEVPGFGSLPGVSPVASEMEALAARLLRLVGEKPEREGLRDTPRRFAKALTYLTSGYATDPKGLVGDAIFNEKAGELVLIKDIEFFSLCEHHMLPFLGRAHVAYIPDGKVIGLSKVPRIVDVFARRLQVQERLTREIADKLDELLRPKGVAVILEASHLCMMMRGVEKQKSSTVTKTMLGRFAEDSSLRAELLSLLKS
ncbi:MAG: GTP cyclohydrolase I FolE [Bdellovibrionales bacterium]